MLGSRLFVDAFWIVVKVKLSLNPLILAGPVDSRLTKLIATTIRLLGTTESFYESR